MHFLSYRIRQLLFIALAVLGGQRTDVWCGLTLDEWESRRPTERAVAVVYKGGKNKKIMGPATMHVTKDIVSCMLLRVTYARPLLRKSTSDLLLPGLQPHDLSGLDNLFQQEKGTLAALCGGNSCRQFHVSILMEFGRLGRLTEEETRRAAFYRRHSLAVAE